MPEGPSIVILKELVSNFKGKKILSVAGNAAIDNSIFINQKVVDFKTWGKHFLICLPKVTIRIHLLLFGTYSINEQIKPDKALRLKLQFKNGAIYFYTCSIKDIEENINEVYDWSADVMNDAWDASNALKKLKLLPNVLICDALLNQEIFAGVGNIIKNEVLYIAKVHPESVVGAIPLKQLRLIIKEARDYSFDFLKWKKAFVLAKHWKVHTKKTCHRCTLPLIKKYPGKTKRRAYFCNNCQVLYK
ncbi:MAG: endonuclease [Sphingobacteriales bacterium]|nr:endonuclease [Sphingobacteriales bacterium]